MDKTTQTGFVLRWDQVSTHVHRNAKAHGFWDGPRNAGEAIALMHSELSEALEAERHGNPPDDKLPEYDGVTVELADCVIRIMDYAAGLGLPLAHALLAKMAYNETRPPKHGKKF